MNKVLAILLSTILLVTGCSPSKGRGVTATPVEGMTATSIHFTATSVLPSATPTILPTSTVTPSPSSLPSPTTNPAIERRCPEFMGEVAMETVANGTIYHYQPNPEVFYLLDLQSGQEYQRPMDGNLPIDSGRHISPNHRYDAFTTNDMALTRTIIWVINAKGEILLREPVDAFWYNLRWLDNERLLLETENTQEQAEVAILNLRTAESTVVSNELPGLFIDTDRGLYWRISYSPDLQKVLYIGRQEDNAMRQIIYRDLVSKKILWQVPMPFGGLGEPVWSPDGRQYALMLDNDLYIIQADGQVVDILKKEKFGYFNEWSYDWSPNGEYIGFRSSKEVGRDPASTLMVYDLKSRKAVDYCLKGYSFDNPAWSPDSTQMIVGSSVGIGGMLIDIPTNRSYKLVDIPGVLYPAGWMFSLPDED